MAIMHNRVGRWDQKLKQIEVYLNNYHTLESIVLLTLADYLSANTSKEIVLYEICDEFEGEELAETLLSFLQIDIYCIT